LAQFFSLVRICYTGKRDRRKEGRYKETEKRKDGDKQNIVFMESPLMKDIDVSLNNRGF
jgi:hypothetical protein